jgi:aryl-alcohol dehydrogenase-like predicted oxidoreductase
VPPYGRSRRLADKVAAIVNLRTLGRTGLAVSEIGFGCGPTGGLMIKSSAAERREAIACAFDLGINYFDTAPGYGASASETNLGDALHELGGARGLVATKVALGLDDLGDIVGCVQRSVEQSLKRLRRDELALIQLHNRIGAQRAPKAEFGTGALLDSVDVSGADGVLEAFERLRARGLVRHFGCSAFGGDMRLVQRLIDSDRVDVLTVHYSILNRTAWRGHAGTAVQNYSEVGSRAASRNMGTVALRALEGGVLPASPTLGAANIGAAEGAIRFVLSNPEVAVVLVGFSNIEQIRNAAVFSSSGPLRPELLHLIEGE